MPGRLRRPLRSAYRRVVARPPVGAIDFGSLDRLEPISSEYGFDRGTPIDRHYIETFIERHASAPSPIEGTVLEIGEDRYASRFAGPGGIGRLDILDVSPTNPAATIVADLADADQLDDDRYDWVICTQTLLLIYDVAAAVATLHRILKPGGTLLVSVPGISQVCVPEMKRWGDHWRFTDRSLERLLGEAFPPEGITVESFGNVMTAAGFLYGLAAEDLRAEALKAHDPRYQVVVAGKAVKGAARG